MVSVRVCRFSPSAMRTRSAAPTSAVKAVTGSKSTSGPWLSATAQPSAGSGACCAAPAEIGLDQSRRRTAALELIWLSSARAGVI